MAPSYVLVLALVAAIHAAIPPDYILRITPACSDSCGGGGSSEGCIKMVTDLNADAKAVCKDGTTFRFNTTDGVNFQLPFNYGPGQDCQFNQRLGSEVYVAKVVVSYGEKVNKVHEYEEEFTITCTFDNKATNGSRLHNVDDTLIAPKEIQTNEGSQSSSSVVLELVDVQGSDLSGTNIDLGRPVSIKAVSTGVENGLKIVSCDALNSTGGRYSFLRAGCGDGIIFDQYQGFISTGKEVASPYFEMFSVGGDDVLRLQCNFTLCAAACDGSSCANVGRRRRGSRALTGASRDFQLETSVASDEFIGEVVAADGTTIV